MAIAVKINWDLSTKTSCIDLSVRTVTKSPKVRPLYFSISLDPPDDSVRQLAGLLWRYRL
jgi:hypothetical protein